VLIIALAIGQVRERGLTLGRPRFRRTPSAATATTWTRRRDRASAHRSTVRVLLAKPGLDDTTAA